MNYSKSYRVIRNVWIGVGVLALLAIVVIVFMLQKEEFYSSVRVALIIYCVGDIAINIGKLLIDKRSKKLEILMSRIRPAGVTSFSCTCPVVNHPDALPAKAACGYYVVSANFFYSTSSAVVLDTSYFSDATLREKLNECNGVS